MIMSLTDSPKKNSNHERHRVVKVLMGGLQLDIDGVLEQ
jgi:hypothetical protein